MKFECRTCPTTGEENFYKNARYQCKSCWNKRTGQAQKDRVKEIKIEYGGKCSKCGYDRYLGALDFHHLDPTQKEFTFSKNRSMNIDALRKELDKCILVCRNCHAEIHFVQ